MSLAKIETSPAIIEARQHYNLVGVSAALWFALQERGKKFVGIERPKGFRRQWRERDCFRNSTSVAFKDKRAIYVEGVAWDLGCGFHHAWITLDGEHAIDPTWPRPGTAYLGITVPFEELCRATIGTRHYGAVIERLAARAA